MLHWTSYRYREMEEKANWKPFVSMGPGYSEFEIMPENYYDSEEDSHEKSISKRMFNYSMIQQPSIYDHRIELAVQQVCYILNSAHNEWIKLDEFTASFAFAEKFEVDPMELYAEVYERYNQY